MEERFYSTFFFIKNEGNFVDAFLFKITQGQYFLVKVRQLFQNALDQLKILVGFQFFFGLALLFRCAFLINQIPVCMIDQQVQGFGLVFFLPVGLLNFIAGNSVKPKGDGNSFPPEFVDI
jgi:hypothetical protein